MPQQPRTIDRIQIPPEPMPDGVQNFSERIQGLMDGRPKDEATVMKAFEGMEEMLDLIAAGLYSFASMLVGEGEDSILLVERAIASTEVSLCQDPVEARKSSRRTMAALALGMLEEREPGCLAAPDWLKPSDTCIDEDDLNAVGVSSEELEHMIAGPDRDRVRKWLAGLPTATRTVFTLRAVAGFNTVETAALLVAHGGPKAAGWSPVAVSEVFRQGLCSLASQVLHAAVEG